MNEKEILIRFQAFKFAGILATGIGVPWMLTTFGSGVEGCFGAFIMSIGGIGCFLGACAEAFELGRIARTLEDKADGGEK